MASVAIGSSPVLLCSGNTRYRHDLWKGETWENKKQLSSKSRPPAVVRMIIPQTGNTVQTTEGSDDVEVCEHHQHLFIYWRKYKAMEYITRLATIHICKSKHSYKIVVYLHTNRTYPHKILNMYTLVAYVTKIQAERIKLVHRIINKSTVYYRIVASPISV